MTARLHNKPILNSTGVLSKIKNKVSEMKRITETYGLIQKLASIDGSNVSNAVLDRVMYSTEALPPLGKEYWWFLFFGRDGERPVQLMLLIFRKYGQNMLFNGKEIALKKLTENKFQAVTAGWVYDGNEIRDLGDTNAVTTIHSERKMIISHISDQEMVLSDGFPEYKLRVGNIIDLKIRKANCLMDKNACGVFLPPFGVGWVDVFSDANGVVLGKKFNGTAHLQKVVGISIFGPFHWGRIVFQNGSSASFFCLKWGRNSKRYFRKSLTFHDIENNEIIKFDNPKLKISKRKNDWVVDGQDDDKDFGIVLETYARKQFTMKGGGSQVYIEYAVTPKEFNLRTKNRVITLDDLGRGVGTFEDAYW